MLGILFLLITLPVCRAHLRATMLLLFLWTSSPSMYMQCLARTLLMLLIALS